MNPPNISPPSSFNLFDWGTAKPLISIDTFLRQLRAPSGVNIEDFGADFSNDNVVKATISAFGNNSLTERKNELGKLNESIYELLENLEKSGLENTHVCHNGSTITIRIELVSGSQIKLYIGNKSEHINMSPAELKHYLETRTVGHTFSKAVLAGSELKKNPARFIDVLAKNRTITGEPVATQRKGAFTNAEYWVLPTVAKKAFPGTDDSVSVHIGNNYIASPNTLEYVDDAATVAYVDDMLIMTVVDGYGLNAKHECSQVHSALISSAALRTIQDLRSGAIDESQLTLEFEKHMINFYSAIAMPEDDTGVTFAGGVTYFNKQGELKLFSYGFSSALFVTVNEDNSITHHHVQKNNYGKPFVRKDNYADLLNFTKTSLTTLDKNAKEFKLGTDGCFSFCENIPVESIKEPLVDLKCKSFPKHGEMSPELTDENFLQQAYEKNLAQSEEADKNLNIVMAKPTAIANAMKITGSKQGKDEFWQALSNTPWPDSLQKPSVTKVEQTIQGLIDIEHIATALQQSTINKDTPMSNLFELVSTDGKKVWQLKNDVAVNATTKALRLAITIVADNRPALIERLGNHTVGTMYENSKKFLMEPVTTWKALIGETDENGTDWCELALDHNDYASHFEKPSADVFARWQAESNKLRNQKDCLDINRKQLAGDDVIFVSVQIDAVKAELIRRSQ